MVKSEVVPVLALAVGAGRLGSSSRQGWRQLRQLWRGRQRRCRLNLTDFLLPLPRRMLVQIDS